MNQAINILLLTGLTAGIFNHAGAQRNGREHGESNRRIAFASLQRNERSHGFYSAGRNSLAGGGNIRENSLNRMATVMPYHGRPGVTGSNAQVIGSQQRNSLVQSQNRGRRYSSGFTQQRVYANNVRGVTYVNRNIYSPNRYYNGRTYYPHVFMAGPRYTFIPRNSITINFGGYPYYYNNGLFYGLYGGYYQPLFPPPGISIRVLPFGYSRIFIGANLFFYFNGIYYRHRDKDNYEVVDAPMGASVSSLPKGAKSVLLNGEKLYELNGTYYKEDRNYKGETVYTVVGKNGEVNNSDSNAGNNLKPASLNDGDVLSQLPEGSKTVTIKEEKLYVTPDGVYLKEESSDGDIVQYKVVGK